MLKAHESALHDVVAAEGSWTTDAEGSMRRVMAALQAAVIEAHAPSTLPTTHEHSYGGRSMTYHLKDDASGYSSMIVLHKST